MGTARKTLTFLSVLISFLAASAARASLIYDTISPSFSVTQGQSISVTVYLHETTTTVIHDGSGLFGAGFAVARDATTYTSLSNPVIDSNFDLVSSTNTLSLAGDSGNRLSRPDVTGPIPATDGRVALGTVTVTGNSVGTSTFTLKDFNTSTSDNLTYAFDDLDSTISNGSFQVTVTAVPEPATLSLLALVAPALLRRRSNRR